MMIYGDKLILTKQGIQFERDVLSSIGIHDGTRCWGILLPHPENEEAPPHLLISPIRPQLWSAILKFDIKIKNNEGQLEKVLKVFEEQEINLHFVECNTSAHNQATLSALGEPLRVKKGIAPLIEKYKTLADKKESEKLSNKEKNDIDKALKNIKNEISIKVFEQIALLKKRIQDENKNEVFSFLSTPVSNFYCERGNEKNANAPSLEVDDESEYTNSININAIAKNQKKESIYISWAQYLAYCCLKKINEKPLEFYYDSEAKFLKLHNDDKDISEHLDKNDLVDIKYPCIGFATFNSSDRIARIIPTLNYDESKLINIDVKYSARSNDTKSPPTLGMVHAISKIIFRRNINIINTSTQIVRPKNASSETETRIISFSGKLKKSYKKSDESNIKEEIEQKFRSKKALNIDAIKIYGQSKYKVFVSTRSDNIENKKLRKIIEKTAFDAGLQPLFVWTYIESTTMQVIDKINQSDAFFQIITLKEREKEKRRRKNKGKPDLDWMIFEYGIARSKNLPSIRLIDTEIIPRETWQKEILIDKEHMPCTIKGFHAKNHEIEDILTQNFRLLRDKINRKKQGD